MPTYGYECLSCKATFEVQQRITEDALKVHEGCGGQLRKLVYPVGISFKGSGFYVNDYAAKAPKSVSGEKVGADKAASTDATSSTEKSSDATSSTSTTTEKSSSDSSSATPAAKPEKAATPST